MISTYKNYRFIVLKIETDINIIFVLRMQSIEIAFLILFECNLIS